MSDFFHENAKDEWRKEAFQIMRQTPRHFYQILTKRPENIGPMLKRMDETIPKNLWLGVTVENASVKHRIDILRSIPARIRFLSIEPLIGSIGELDLTGIHWVIVGAESGPRRRNCDLKNVCEIVDQCAEQNVPVFVKQLHIGGKLSKDPVEWLSRLRVQDYPAL